MPNTNQNGFAKELVAFFKHASHLWGRCPNCDSVFRLSEAAISARQEPPKDWLRRLERREDAIAAKEGEISERELLVEDLEQELRGREREVQYGEDRLERNAKQRVREILKSQTEVQRLIREASKDAVKRSRATLLGRMLERLAPCFRKFAYDPRDMRSICDPYDYVLFNGLTVERKVKNITFIEIKCGMGRETSVQRSLREAVDEKRVFAEVWEIGSPDIPITKQLPRTSRRALPPAQEE
jgi:predicted Holliday junction resolvase-like endonuclease